MNRSFSFGGLKGSFGRSKGRALFGGGDYGIKSFGSSSTGRRLMGGMSFGGGRSRSYSGLSKADPYSGSSSKPSYGGKSSFSLSEGGAFAPDLNSPFGKSSGSLFGSKASPLAPAKRGSRGCSPRRACR